MLPAAIIFLLLFATLAFVWFYLQRAKGRDAATTATGVRAETASDTATTDPAP